MSVTCSVPPVSEPAAASRREWAGLVVLLLPTVLLALDMTVLHLATPQLSAALRPTAPQLLWILDIYGFMIAGFLITMGSLGDRIGRRRLLLAGAAAFALASIAAAFSTSAEMLIVTRALLGVAGATLMPSTLSLIRHMFKRPQQRRVAITVWMTGFIIGSALGPLVGGLMLEFFWWGSVFLLGVPVMLVLLVAGPLLLPESRAPGAGRIDLGSALLCIGALLALIHGLKHIARHGPEPTALMVIAAGLLVAAVFSRRQLRLADPMLDLRLFTRPTFSVSIAAILLTIMAMSGVWLMVFQYLQGALGLSPLRAGLWMLPAALAQFLIALVIPRLSHRFAPGPLAAVGLAVAAAGILLLTRVEGAHALAVLVLGTTLMGVGSMPMMILGTDLVIGSAPPERAGSASATSETAAELGMALGIAVIGSVGALVYSRAMLAALPAGLDPLLAVPAVETLGGALAAAAELDPQPAQALLASARLAFEQALHANAVIGAVMVATTAVLAALWLRAVPATESH